MNAEQPQSKPPSPPQVEAKLEPHEIELKKKQELLAKVRIVRERLIANRGQIQGHNKSKEYVWVNVADSRQVHFQALGYTKCTDLNIQSPWKREDNSHQRGDLVLYEIDKDLHEAIQLDAELRAVEASEGAREGFKALAQREGVPIYEPGKGRR